MGNIGQNGSTKGAETIHLGTKGDGIQQDTVGAMDLKSSRDTPVTLAQTNYWDIKMRQLTATG